MPRPPNPSWRVPSRPCPFYSQGKCYFAESCNFVHDVKAKAPRAHVIPEISYSEPDDKPWRLSTSSVTPPTERAISSNSIPQAAVVESSFKALDDAIRGGENQSASHPAPLGSPIKLSKAAKHQNRLARPPEGPVFLEELKKYHKNILGHRSHQSSVQEASYVENDDIPDFSLDSMDMSSLMISRRGGREPLQEAQANIADFSSSILGLSSMSEMSENSQPMTSTPARRSTLRPLKLSELRDENLSTDVKPLSLRSPSPTTPAPAQSPLSPTSLPYLSKSTAASTVTKPFNALERNLDDLVEALSQKQKLFQDVALASLMSENFAPTTEDDPSDDHSDITPERLPSFISTSPSSTVDPVEEGRRTPALSPSNPHFMYPTPPSEPATSRPTSMAESLDTAIGIAASASFPHLEEYLNQDDTSHQQILSLVNPPQNPVLAGFPTSESIDSNEREDSSSVALGPATPTSFSLDMYEEPSPLAVSPSERDSESVTPLTEPAQPTPVVTGMAPVVVPDVFTRLSPPLPEPLALAPALPMVSSLPPSLSPPLPLPLSLAPSLTSEATAVVAPPSPLLKPLVIDSEPSATVAPPNDAAILTEPALRQVPFTRVTTPPPLNPESPSVFSPKQLTLPAILQNNRSVGEYIKASSRRLSFAIPDNQLPPEISRKSTPAYPTFPSIAQLTSPLTNPTSSGPPHSSPMPREKTKSSGSMPMRRKPSITSPPSLPLTAPVVLPSHRHRAAAPSRSVASSQVTSASKPHLFFALASDSPKQVSQLLDSGEADANDTAGPFDLPALVFSLSNDQLVNKTEMVKTLLSHGADPSVVQHLVPPEEPTPATEDAREDLEDSPLAEKIRESMNPAIKYYLGRSATPSQRQLEALQVGQYDPLLRARFHLVGQDMVLDELMRAVASHSRRKNSKASLSLVLAGPSGHGKSHLASKIGHLLSSPLYIVNMTNLRSQEDLMGAKSLSAESDNSDNLLHFITRHEKSRCVVVLEEIEKTAEKHVLHTLLMPWELGKLQTATFEVIDTSEVIWVCTSNAGEEQVFDFHHTKNMKAASAREEYAILMTRMRGRLADALGPSIISRLNAVLPFLPFTKEEQRVLASETLTELVSREESPPTWLTKPVSEDLVERAVSHYIEREGARSIHRAVQNLFEEGMYQ